MIVREGHRRDFAAIRGISLATGQPETDSGADFEYLAFLSTTGTLLVAVEPDGKLVGWGATRSTIAASMLTDLFIDPSRQGAGVGGRILSGLWPHQPEARPQFTFSSRHPHALPLYGKAGLLPRWPLLYLSGARQLIVGHEGLRVSTVSGATAADADVHLTGVDRAADYEFWTRRSDASGIVIRAPGRIAACGVVRPGEVLHVTCPDADHALDAIVAALALAGGAKTTVCLPGPHPAVPALLRAGFRVEDYDIAMSTSAFELPTTWAYSPSLA